MLSGIPISCTQLNHFLLLFLVIAGNLISLNSKIMVPDWSHAVQVTAGSEITVTGNGYIVASGYASSGNTTLTIAIGGITIYQMAAEWVRASLIVPVKKGDKLTIGGNLAGWDARHFVPCVT